MKAASLGHPMLAVTVEIGPQAAISIVSAYPGQPPMPIMGDANIRALREFCSEVLEDAPVAPAQTAADLSIWAEDLKRGAEMFGLDHDRLLDLMDWLKVEVSP